jgi:hypothetical protein
MAQIRRKAVREAEAADDPMPGGGREGKLPIRVPRPLYSRLGILRGLLGQTGPYSDTIEWLMGLDHPTLRKVRDLTQ